MASSAAPEAYLGFNTGPVSRKTATKKIINHDLSASQPSRKVARLTKSEITTSSWRKNAKNARKLLKQQSDVKFESKVSPNDIHKPVPMEQDTNLHMDDEIGDEDSKSIVDEIKKNEIENILSPEVKDILKELQLDLVPNGVESEPAVNEIKHPKTKKRTQKTTSVPNIQNPVSKKERHYKSDDVKLYMQKQKEKRRLEKLKLQEEQKLKEEKINHEMEKLKATQRNMNSKKKSVLKSSKFGKETKAIIHTAPSFDPYAKALQIIGDLENTKTSSSKQVHSSVTESSSSNSNKISIPEFKSLPGESIKPNNSMDEVLSKLNSSGRLSAISATMKVETYLNESIENIDPKPVGEPKIQNLEHQNLLASLKKQSEDIEKRTKYWTKEIAKIEQRKARQTPPGSQMVRITSPEPVEEFPQMEPQTIQSLVQSDVSVPNQSPRSPSPIVNSTPRSSSPAVQKNTAPQTYKNVKFVRAKSPDELNLVNLMYQREKERRKTEKRKKKHKRTKSERSVLSTSSQISSVQPSASLIAISRTSTDITTNKTASQTKQTESNSTISSDKISSEHKHGSESIQDSYSFTQHSDNSSTNEIKTSKSLSHTGTITTTASNRYNSSSQAPTDSHIVTNSSIQSDTNSNSESQSIRTESKQTYSPSYQSETPTTETPTTDVGNTLGRIMIDQINQNEVLDHNLKTVDKIESNLFLTEMRQIQETGKKAAELMLKASKNLARQADISVTTSNEITSTGITSTGQISEPAMELNLESGPLPDSSDDEKSEKLTSSGTITSKITPRESNSTDSNLTPRTNRSDQTETIATVPTGSTLMKTKTEQSEYTTEYSKTPDYTTASKTTKKTTSGSISTEKYSEKFPSEEESDFDRSLTILTPSVEHRLKLRTSFEAEVSSSDIDPADESFTRFMKDMVDQYVDSKISRQKHEQTVKSAKEKAAKEKKKREKDMKRYYKSKRVFDEKMPSYEANSGSDTSFASTSTVDRVKKWFSTMNEQTLTKREQDLQKRRKRAEKLLKWKRRLDEQEKSIIRIEEEAKLDFIPPHTESEVSTATEDTTNHTTFSETDLDHSDAEIQIRVMKEKLDMRKREQAKLKKQLKKSENNYEKQRELKGKEVALKKQIEKLDEMITEAKYQLDVLANEDFEPGIKPRIRSPSKDSSISSSSSNNLRSSKIKSIDFEDSVSPRRSSPLIQSQKTSSSISSDCSTVEDILTKTDRPSETVKSSEIHRDRLGGSQSPTDIKSQSIDSIHSCEISTGTVTAEHNEDEISDKPIEVLANKLLNSSADSDEVINGLVNELVDDFISNLDNRQEFTNKIKQKSSDDEGEYYFDTYFDSEEATIDLQVNLLPAGDELEDDSLIKALLEHVERQDSSSSPRPQPIVNQSRSFTDVTNRVESFSIILFNSKNPLSEPLPQLDNENDREFMTALWTMCAELADSCFNHQNIQNQEFKPWERPRLNSKQRFSKYVPKTAKELSRVIQSELKLLFSPNGPKLDERVIQKMGSKSKKDRVDLLLIGELRDEEKLWTQYDEDEDCVLNNLNQIIFDQLIDDTIQAVKDVQNQRACLL